MSTLLSDRALQRRLKRYLLKENQTFFAMCAPPFESVLETEVRTLPDVNVTETFPGGVEFTGPLDTMYHANLRLRTAHRVLLRIDEFLAQSYPMLFNKASKVPWELYLGRADTLSIHVSARASRLRHHKNIAATLHSAVLETLTPFGPVPKLDADASFKLHARLFRDHCTLSLDTSGTHLHKRGYRVAGARAPIRETLAAGVLMAVGWEDYSFILDPMCGAGTFLIEAAHLAKNIAPGGARSFAFESFPSFQESKWWRFRAEAAAEVRAVSPIRLLGNDIDERALRTARANAERAGVARDLTFVQGDALEFGYNTLTGETPKTLILCNLPYAERLGEERETKRLYRDFVSRLKAAGGLEVALVSAKPEWLLEAGYKPHTRLAFRNGGLHVELLQATL